MAKPNFVLRVSDLNDRGNCPRLLPGDLLRPPAQQEEFLPILLHSTDYAEWHWSVSLCNVLIVYNKHYTVK